MTQGRPDPAVAGSGRRARAPQRDRALTSVVDGRRPRGSRHPGSGASRVGGVAHGTVVMVRGSRAESPRELWNALLTA